MKYTVIVLLLLLLLVVSNLTFAQNNHFIKNKNGDSSNKLEYVKKKKANKKCELIEVDLETIISNDEVILEFDDLYYSIKKETFKIRNVNNFTFIGKNKENDGAVIISVLEGNIQGTVQKGNRIFIIETLDDGEYAIIEQDHSKFEEKCHILDNTMIETIINSTELSKEHKLKSSSNFICNVRVLVLFTPAAKNSVSSIMNTINLAIDETNQSFINSNIGYSVELAYAEETNYVEDDMETDLERFVNNGDNYMDEVHSLRSKYSADVCVLLNDDASGYCGLANAIGASETEAFCIVKTDGCATGYFSFGHEIGHLLGSRHDTYMDNASSPFAYGHGYVSPFKNWRTIMAYGNACNGCPRMLFWSNPDIDFIGVPMGTNSTNDNARVWDEESDRIMAFMQPPSFMELSSTDFSGSLYGDVISTGEIILAKNITLPQNSNITLKAKSNIEIQEGFKVNSGSEFKATIESVSGCSSSKSATVLGTNVNDIESNFNKEITIFPNPSNGIININFELNDGSDIYIDLVDLLGKTVKTFSKARFEPGRVEKVVNFSSKGTFFLRIKIDEQEYVEKVIFQ